MRRLSGWMLTGAVCVVTAGCSQPDLIVSGEYLPTWYCTKDSYLVLDLVPDIKNIGKGDAVLAKDWTKPWITAYVDPAVKMPPYLRPYQTCTGGEACPLTLKSGDSVTVPMKILLPPAPGGSAYNLIVEVDPSNVIKESDESNNTNYVPVPANVCG